MASRRSRFRRSTRHPAFAASVIRCAGADAPAAPTAASGSLALMIACALAGTTALLPDPVRAENAAGATGAANAAGAANATEADAVAASRDYAIAAGTLGDVVAEFATLSGVLLSFDPALLAGQGSSGLRGRYTVRGGFAHLLAESGYEAVEAGTGRFALRRTAAPATGAAGPAGSAGAAGTAGSTGLATLPAVTVRAAYEAAALSRVKADTATITRSGASLLDTPMSVSVIPSQTTVDQAAQTIGDVVRNVPGLLAQTYVGTYESIYARGFWASTTSNHLRNGFRFVHLVQPAQHNVERYEVIKGAMSMDYGRVEPGALFNIVTKQPQAETLREITFGIGQRNFRELGFDLAGSLDEAGTVLYRLNGGTMRQAYATTAIDPEQHDIAGALAFKLAPRTQLDLDYEYTRRTQLTATGVPVPDPLNVRSADPLVDKFYGEREGRFKGHHRFLSARLKHQLSDDWQVSLGYANSQTYRDNRNIYFQGIRNGLAERMAYPFDQTFDMQSVVAELKGRLMLAGMEHHLTVTADSVGYRDAGHFSLADSSMPPVDPFNPVYTGAPALLVPLDAQASGKLRDGGIALQDRIIINPKWQVLAGLRYSRYSETPPDYSGSGEPVQRQKGSHVDPMVGAVYKLQPWASLYGSYSRSSNPNTATRTAPGEYADPSRARQFEVGAKADWLDGRLRTSIARFDLTKTNIPTASLANPSFQEITGEIRVKGWELEAAGQLTPRWSVIAGYSIADGEITRDNDVQTVGRTPAITPRRLGNLWTTYELGGAAEGWTLGTGVFHTGGKYLNNSNEAKLPSYTIVDLMAAYRFRTGLPGARLRFNLRNVFDKTYYESGSANGVNVDTLYPGLPRMLSATLVVPF